MIPRLSTIAQFPSSPVRPAALWISRRLALGLIVAGVAMITAASFSSAPVAYCAACKWPNQSCGPDLTKTSVLDVAHSKSYGDQVVPVEPASGESWSITAYWNSANVPCSEHQETATVDVDWNDTTWVPSNKVLTTHIVDIQLCPLDALSCHCVDGHSAGYRLVVDLNDPVGILNLRQVVYTTTAVDGGYELDLETCTLGSSVSPLSQSFSQTDTGGFECELTCATISGPSLTIAYQ